MPTQLVVIAGPDKGRSYAVAAGVPVLVGRGSNTTTKLVDLHVSRVHCELTWDGAKAVLKDNNSAAGTFLNGQRVTTANMRSGDVVRIGETELRFEAELAEMATLPPGAVTPQAVAAAMKAATPPAAAPAPAKPTTATKPATVAPPAAKPPTQAPAPPARPVAPAAPPLASPVLPPGVATAKTATHPPAPAAPPPATPAKTTAQAPAVGVKTVAQTGAAAPGAKTVAQPATPASSPRVSSAPPAAPAAPAAPSAAPPSGGEGLVLAKRVGGPALPPWAKPLNNLIGKSLGRYELHKLLGTGTVGVVFLAKDTSDQKWCALKVFRPDFTKDEKSMQRFLRGMKTAIGFNHPHLINLFNAAITEPHCWLAMEHVDGESLAEIIRKPGAARPEWQRAWRVAHGIGQALHYLHERGVIHRGVLPQNIMIRKSDQAAKLGDVMLAKALEGNVAQEVTESGEIVGNLYYMAPERTQSSDNVDGRSDLYSLGATLYHFVTGRMPVQGTNMLDIINKIRQTPPAPPSQFNPGIPPAFEQVILKLLAKQPESRYQSAPLLVADLDKVAKALKV